MTYNLKQAAKRGVAFAGAMGLLGAFAVSALPAATFADALNPLTERTLTLSSSEPGWSFVDGSGNGTYAQPGAGDNGKETGETFSFKVSTDSSSSDPAIKGFSFQYCTSAAGVCDLPGNGQFSVANATSYLNVNYTTSAVEGTDFEVYTANLDAAKTANETTYAAASTAVQSQVATDLAAAEALNSGDPGYVDSSDPSAVTAFETSDTITVEDAQTTTDYNSAVPEAAWATSGWTISNVGKYEDAQPYASSTENNYVTLSNSTGITPAAGDKVWVVFKPSDTSYITNPGDLMDPMYVRINDYSTADDTQMLGYASSADWSAVTGTNVPTYNTDDSYVVDGGVTVADVMNESIHITTKVLETMTFSVGTADPDDSSAVTEHGACDTLWHNPKTNPTDGAADTASAADPNPATADAYDWNLIRLGDPNNQYALSPTDAGTMDSEDHGSYDTADSYWRLSTNSAAGAVVYYSGDTLYNTEGNHIEAIGEASGNYNVPSPSSPGTEQFGLGLDTNADANFTMDSTSDPTGSNPQPGYVSPSLSPLTPTSGYGDAGSGTPEYAFNRNSLTSPQPMAEESNSVIQCSTGHVYYVANIAPFTPAGTYATKINYIAAPQY